MTSDYHRPLCPACNAKVSHSVNVEPGGGHSEFVYCVNPRCPSGAASKGMDGATVTEAMEKLRKAIEKEAA